MKILGKVLATTSLLFLLPTAVFAYSDFSFIGATVKISVCGDGIVEGQEDCEKSLNQMFNCIDFGYLPDIIYCDNSCAYDLLSCKPIKPIAPITPIIIDPDSEEQEETGSMLPILLNNWDTDNDGVLTMEEFTSFIVNWVNSWKSFVTLPKENSEKDTVAKQCDINSDDTCNVTDFSIILYYLRNE